MEQELMAGMCSLTNCPLEDGFPPYDFDIVEGDEFCHETKTCLFSSSKKKMKHIYTKCYYGSGYSDDVYCKTESVGCC